MTDVTAYVTCAVFREIDPGNVTVKPVKITSNSVSKSSAMTWFDRLIRLSINVLK